MRQWPVLFFALFLLPGGAEANYQQKCARLYNQFKPLLANLPKEEATRILDEAALIKVEDFFPEIESFSLGPKKREVRVVLKEKKIREYEDFFDKVWRARLSLNPRAKDEYVKFKDWLRDKNIASSGYPILDPKNLHEEFYSDGATVLQHMDYAFIAYAMDTHRSLTDVAKIDEYLSSIHSSIFQNVAQVIVRSARRVAKTKIGIFGLGVVTATASSLTIDKLREYINNKVKTAGEQVVSAVVDWGKIFVGGEEAYSEALLKLQLVMDRFRADTVAVRSQPRKQAIESFEISLKELNSTLPGFYEITTNMQKDFETKWNDRLKEIKNSLEEAESKYSAARSHSEILNSVISSRNRPATPEELESLAFHARAMKKNEERLAAFLSDWIFRKVAFPKDKALDPAVEKVFQDTYDFYIQTMNVSQLAAEVERRVVAHFEQLQKYQIRKKTGADLSAVPKPEDQISNAGNQKPGEATPKTLLSK